MKYTTIFAAIVFLALLGIGAGQKAQAQPSSDVGFDVFYSNLSPYGEWVDVDFGHAWRPYNISRGWRPYMYGRWMWTDDGWYWSSDEPFGWATYHYGRWSYDDYYGWIWIPDNVWAPSWVEWRYSDDYVGWAPLPPAAHFEFGFGISYTQTWAAPVYYWNFVPCRNFASVRINEYVQPIDRTRRIFGSTRGRMEIEGRGDRVVNRGIDPAFIERHGNLRIGRADIVPTERGSSERIVRGDGGRDRVEVYRPHIEGSGRGDSRLGQQEHRAPAERNYDGNNSGRRSYNQIPGNRGGDTRPNTGVRRETPPAQRAPEPVQEQVRPRFQQKTDGNRRTVETPERWRRQSAPENKQNPGAFTPQTRGGGSRQPQGVRPSQPARPTPQEHAAPHREERRGGGGGGRRG